MKKLHLLFISFVFSLVSFAQTAHINAVQFKQLSDRADGVILDVRTPQEFSRGHIEGATLINIADRQFVNKVNLLNKEKPVYIYCLTGSRSRTAARYMESIGFKQIFNLQRGILDWQQNSYMLVKSDNQVASAGKAFSPESFAQLIQSDEIVLVDFHAPWCAPCKKMSPVIDQLSSNYAGKIKVEKIDVEANQALAKANEIQSIPGFILYKNGKKVWLHKGMISYSDLASVINNHL